MNRMAGLKREGHWVDQFGRTKRKLRISVTDRCNFKCVYCMPEHPEWMKKHDLLSFEQLYLFCEFMVRRGIESIRITGGEPLMRQGVVHFIAQLQQLKLHGLKRISMTSNAHYLKQYALALKQAGLDDLNISLDSLDANQFKQLTQKQLTPVLEGIAAAQAVGLPIKINSVLIKGINDDQILPLAHWSVQENINVRFIEFMPLDGERKWSSEHVVSEHAILAQLKTAFNISNPLHQSADPARQYLINDHPIGIISTMTHSFCGSCDRLRLTAQGEFYNCLFAPQGLDLKSKIKALAAADPFSETSLEQTLMHYIWNKEQGFHAIEQRLNQQNSHQNNHHTNSQINHQNSNQNVLKNNRKISMHMLGG